MKIKHHELEIPPDDPFKNCKLQRKKYAEVLTRITETYADGFVLAINNEWGTGKTTFVKMWEQSLKTKGFNTIYFNAWENDFDNIPLVAFMSELKNIVTSKNEAIFKSAIEKGAALTKNVVPSLIKRLQKNTLI
jgi:predicted KAP-like P-loop ATPase